jgi:hypothetical protein
MKILLIHPEDQLCDLLKFFLTRRFIFTMHRVNTNEEAIQRLDEATEPWSLLICDYSYSAKTLVPFVLKNRIKTQFLFLALAPQVDALNAKTKEGFFFVHRGTLLTGLEQQISSMSQLIKFNQESSDHPDFAKTTPDLLVHASPISTDVYAQLSNQKFVKVIRAGEVFSDHEADYFKNKKKLDHLWIHKDDIDPLSEQILQNLVTG